MVRTASEENLKASDKLFAELVNEAHKRKIRVIMDGVFNHCGSFNRWMDREKIYEEIWGSEYSVESRTLDLHIQRLRKKLDIGDSLKTVFKAGYRLEE